MTSASCASTSLSFAPAARPARAVAARKPAVTCWQLPEGRAMTFTAHTAGFIGLARGQLWLTFSNTGRIDAAGRVDTTRAHPLRRTGDFLLWPGEQFALLAGESVVLESFGVAAQADISWQPDEADREAVTRQTPRLQHGAGSPLRDLHDLRHALAQATMAAARLLRGLIGTVLGGLALSTHQRAALQGRSFDAVSNDPSVHCRLY